MKKSEFHQSVMVREVIENLHIDKKGNYIDATVGTGGHSLEMVKKGADVLGIEADKEMIEIARERLKAKIVQGNFRNIDKIASENKFEQVDGIIFDLGVTNIQLLSQERGFSFSNPGAPLDMRLDKDNQGVTAADLLNGLREDQLKKLFSQTLRPNQINYIVKNILLRRESKPFVTVGDLMQVCSGLRVKGGLNPATLPFLALRIGVNSELENLKEALSKAMGLMKAGGRLLVIVFNSKERGVVLDFVKDGVKKDVLRLVTDEPIEPGEEEIKKNPRSRSAKLYVIEKR